MPKILAATTAAALAAFFIINTLTLQERAQAVFVPIPAAQAAAPFPSAPDATMTPAPASAKKTATAPTQPASKKAAQAPVRLSIPAIALSERVVPVGVNSRGDLDVPSGSTNNIGWYAKGTVPGQMGSAVMDAHVFAGFSHLNEVAAGDDIYVGMADGTTRRFTATKAKVFALADLSPEELYSQNDGRYLHLITCAGSLTPDRSTYTHRLVVYATLAE